MAVFFVWMCCFVSLSCWLQDKRVADILCFKSFRDLFRTSWNKSLGSLNGSCIRNASDSSVKGHCYTWAATRMALSAVWGSVFFLFLFFFYHIHFRYVNIWCIIKELKSWRCVCIFFFTTGHFWNCRPVLLLCARTLFMWTDFDSVGKH